MFIFPFCKYRIIIDLSVSFFFLGEDFDIILFFILWSGEFESDYLFKIFDIVNISSSSESQNEFSNKTIESFIVECFTDLKCSVILDWFMLESSKCDSLNSVIVTKLNKTCGLFFTSWEWEIDEVPNTF